MMAIRTASMLCVLLLALTAQASEQAIAEPPAATSSAANAIVQQPRTFGYFLGDVVTQRVLLELDGKRFEPEALPRVERVGVWFERRPSPPQTAWQPRPTPLPTWDGSPSPNSCCWRG